MRLGNHSKFKSNHNYNFRQRNIQMQKSSEHSPIEKNKMKRKINQLKRKINQSLLLMVEVLLPLSKAQILKQTRR